ncbi:MAG: iron complex outerrane recepter protein [Gammaproteobacteria bacterium]|nr:iron complex outerrane recepter protein [Gammaproteobacteria bacterium]
MSTRSNKAQQFGLRLAIAMLCAGGSSMCSSAALADTATTTATSEASADAAGLDEIIVTGSRQAGLKAADSPAPIQILSADSLAAASGNPDLMSTLSQLVPSLTMQAFGFDMAGQTLQAKLRGLSPNHVLVLINGKRRHTTANLAVDTGSTYQGGAGVDLNFIPLDAIEHIEVLTDGAAAQYGTDAIAGVINIILKKNTSGGVVNGTYGQYGNDGGGKTEDVSAQAGFEPSDGGYFSLTGQFHNHGHSNVGNVDERVVNPANFTSYPDSNLPNVPGYPNLNRISGDGAQQSKLLLVNMGFDFANGTELYSTITYGKKNAASYENYRLPDKAVYTDAQTGATVVPYPFGFNPQEASDENDYQFNAGLKGSIAGWNWDVGTGFGGDKVSISTIDTFSFQPQALGVPSPANFYDGYLQATQWTSTADVNKDFDVGLAGPLNVAFGAEYRRETYSIGAGVPYSYEGGGASSYPGFAPSSAGTNSRKNYAGYVDFAANPISGLRLDAAGRFEHYNDFGSATVGKLTGRYDFTPEFALRGTISNGFRAPTLAEEYYTSTNVGPTTAYVQIAPNSPAGKLLGLGDGLKPEHSVNLSLGMVWRPTPGMSTTLDVYQITVTNRIVGSGQIIGTKNGALVSAPVTAAVVASGAAIDPAVLSSGTTGINVFANGIDTRTRGADLVFDFPVEYSFGKIVWSVGATYNDTTITKYAGTPALLAGGSPPTNELYDPTAISDLTTANPKYVVNLGSLFTTGKLSVNLVEKIYGPSSEYGNDDGDNGGTGAGTYPGCVVKPGTLFICPGGFDYFESKIGVTAITNLDLSYKMSEHVKFSLGANNLFNRFPGKLNATLRAHENSFAYGDNAGVTQYPTFSPFGINGGFYYVKASYTF